MRRNNKNVGVESLFYRHSWLNILLFHMVNRNLYENFLFLLLHVVNILLQFFQDIAEKQIFFWR